MQRIPITFPTEFEPEDVPVEVLDRQERDRQVVDWFERAMHILRAYQSHQSKACELQMSFRCMMLALGFSLVAGADGPAELARKCKVTKACLDKCLNHFIAQLQLDPLPGQRKKEAREAMSAARKSQLKSK